VTVRNLRITQTYHDLARGMAGLLGWRNTSWCCFGTWASRTAGRFIRGEAVPRGVLVMEAIAERVPARLRALTPAALVLIVRQVAQHVAHGNLIVFQDLGPLYARMLDAFTGSTDLDHAAAQCTATLRPGPVTAGGDDLLADAVRAYRDAISATDPDARAELILLANLRIGLHEQIRLQEPITHALLSMPSYRFAPAPLRNALATTWKNLATAQLMDIRLPSVDFETTRRLTAQQLGANVGRGLQYAFPPNLAQLQNQELKALLYDLDRSPNTVLGSAADDWSDLSDRMNFIADLFRAWQQTPRLFLPPFTPTQTQTIRAGQLPHGGPPL